MNASYADLSDLIALEIACFADAWSEKSLSEALRDEKYLVLIHRAENDAASAYLIGWEIAGEAELARIGVVLASRGQGLARQILDEALENWRNRGANRVFLEVRASNIVAQRLYASRGFEVVGKRANYYEDGEDALIFELSVSFKARQNS